MSDIYNLIQQQKIEQQRRFSSFMLETIKAFHSDYTLRNPNSSALEIIHASNELGKYMGKCIRKEF